VAQRKLLELKALILDNDGGLIDSSSIAIARFKRVAKDLGLAPPTKRQIQTIWGRPWHEVVRYFWPDEHQLFTDTYLADYHTVQYKTFPGLPKQLSRLSKGLKLAVLTSRDKTTFTRRLAEAGIPTDLFMMITTMDDAPYHKPDPRVFDAIWLELQKLDIKKTEIAYAGDTLIDMQAVKGFGGHFIALCTGPFQRKDFLQAGVPPHLILDTPVDLSKIIKNHHPQKEGKMEEKKSWICPRCHLTNLDWDKTCHNCGADKEALAEKAKRVSTRHRSSALKQTRSSRGARH
jgi:phosphoglycolate phosphatase-like HAD superfamily hydrolase